MSKETINILPDNIANKIAAGEVVQRPASVLKELVENSLDASATKVEVFIKGAGKTLIQVIDDGEGMGEEDAVKCILRHATSKIHTVDDLNEIKTFGFRGEALSSIASVSKLELKTETRDDELGTVLTFDDENGLIKDKGSFSKGTSVSVKNLFYNTPARRKFLKTNATELKHLIETFKKFALSNPEVHFVFYNDDDIIFEYPASSIQERIENVVADNIFDAVVEVNEETELISLKGYIAKPTYLRKSKGDQYVFINKRFVTSKTINHAVFSAYENILEKGDYPFFVLYLTLDPKKVDVNVHPAKLEIKFDDENAVYRFVNAVVKKGLGKYDLVPNVSFRDDDSESEKLAYTNYKRTGENDFSDRPDFGRRKRSESQKGIFSEDEIDAIFKSINPGIKETSRDDTGPLPFDEPVRKEISHTSPDEKKQPKPGENATFIISLHNKYILSQIKSGLMIIDQHVAHERILYEKALRSFEANIPFAQQLLFAQTIQVDPADYELLKEIEPYLQKLGFEIKFFSKRTVVINGVPSDIKVGSEVETLKEILNEYRANERKKNLEIRDNLAKSFSCKAAIKAGDKLSEHEMRLLVDQLFATSMPYVCPHGRPIIIKIPLDELDKRFGRT